MEFDKSDKHTYQYTEKRNETLIDHLERFFKDRESAQKAVDNLLNNSPEISGAEIFRQLSCQKGKGKSHESKNQNPKMDGVLKRKGRPRQKSRRLF